MCVYQERHTLYTHKFMPRDNGFNQQDKTLHVDGLVQDCSNYIANAVELL